MYVSANQFYVFIASVAIGGLGAVPFSIFYPLKKILNNKIISSLIDFCCCLILLGAFILISYKLNFPSLRAYMLVGVFIGVFLYLKSFNILLAKCTNKVYNILNKFKVKIFKCKKKNSKGK